MRKYWILAVAASLGLWALILSPFVFGAGVSQVSSYNATNVTITGGSIINTLIGGGAALSLPVSGATYSGVGIGSDATFPTRVNLWHGNTSPKDYTNSVFGSDTVNTFIRGSNTTGFLINNTQVVTATSSTFAAPGVYGENGIPSFSVCGTSPAFFAGQQDRAFAIVTGTALATQCIINMGGAAPNKWVCTASMINGGISGGLTVSGSGSQVIISEYSTSTGLQIQLESAKSIALICQAT